MWFKICLTKNTELFSLKLKCPVCFGITQLSKEDVGVITDF